MKKQAARVRWKRARVTAIENGAKGTFAVSVLEKPPKKVTGSVTFSREAWETIGHEPKVGDIVYLAKLGETTKGWRAERARLSKV